MAIYTLGLTASNFLAALGGGMILGKGIDIIDHPFFKEGSILAFFIGTVFGLLFLKIIQKKQQAIFLDLLPF